MSVRSSTHRTMDVAAGCAVVVALGLLGGACAEKDGAEPAVPSAPSADARTSTTPSSAGTGAPEPSDGTGPMPSAPSPAPSTTAAGLPATGTGDGAGDAGAASDGAPAGDGGTAVTSTTVPGEAAGGADGLTCPPEVDFILGFIGDPAARKKIEDAYCS